MTIKSADDLNEQKRESDVLITAIEKCERLEKKLKVAVKALEHIERDDYMGIYGDIAQEALAKIKELEND